VAHVAIMGNRYRAGSPSRAATPRLAKLFKILRLRSLHTLGA